MKWYEAIWNCMEVTWSYMKWHEVIKISMILSPTFFFEDAIWEYLFFVFSEAGLGLSEAAACQQRGRLRYLLAATQIWARGQRGQDHEDHAGPCWTLPAYHLLISGEYIEYHDISGDHMRSWDILCLNKWGKKDVLWRFHVVPQLALRHLVSLSG